MIYFIGIDISKYKHDFCIISNTSEVIVELNSSILTIFGINEITATSIIAEDEDISCVSFRLKC